MPPRPVAPRESDAADKVFVDVSDDENEEGWTSVNIDGQVGKGDTQVKQP